MRLDQGRPHTAGHRCAVEHRRGERASVVKCACDAIIAGLDSSPLRILAGLSRTEADYSVLGILPAALAELGLDFYPRDTRGGQGAVERTLPCRPCPGR